MPKERTLDETARGATPCILDEPSLFYDPPYEHPLDDRLAAYLVRYLAPSCALQYRTVALTPDDCFRADFLIEQHRPRRGLRRVAIQWREEAEAPLLQDALMVGSGAVDVLYRFRESDLEEHLCDALFLAVRWDPLLFEDGSREHLMQHASREAQRSRVWPGQKQVRLAYPSPPVEVRPGKIPERPASPSELVVRRLSREHPATWRQAYRRALSRLDLPEAPRRVAWPRRAWRAVRP